MENLNPETIWFAMVSFAYSLVDSGIFIALKWFLIVYSSVLILDIVLLLALRGVGSDVRAQIKGMNIPATPPRVMRKRWKKIISRLETGLPAQYKIAVLEADLFVDDILKRIGYQGENMGEKLAQLKPGQLDYLDELRSAHAVRNRIVQEADFSLDKQSAQEVLDVYEDFLKYLEYL